MKAGEEGIYIMNAEKVLTWSVAALGHLKDGANGNAAEILNYLKTEAENEIRHAAAKASGNGNRQKAAERVIKNAITEQPHAEKLHGAWISKGKQCICDGFRVFRLPDALPLPEIPQNVKTMDADGIVNPARLNEGAMLDVPDAATLRAYIKEEKARKKAIRDRSGILWDFGDGLPAVNAQYLLDALEILPGAVFFPSTRRPLLDAIYISSAYGDGVLLPVRVPAKMEAR